MLSMRIRKLNRGRRMQARAGSVFMLAVLAAFCVPVRVFAYAGNERAREIRIQVRLPIDRKKTGTLTLVDARGATVAGPFPVLGKSTGRIWQITDGRRELRTINANGDPTKLLGDTPTGSYRVDGFIKTGDPQHPYDAFGKNFIIKMTPTSGEAYKARNRDPGSPGNPGIYIHAGREAPDGRLSATHGCLRVHEETIIALYDAIVIRGRAPTSCSVRAGAVSVSDDMGPLGEDLDQPGSWEHSAHETVTRMPPSLHWGRVVTPHGSYDGEVSNRIVPNGMGRMRTSSGLTAEGRFIDGLLVEGTVTSDSGKVLVGRFDDGEMVQGKATMPNGTVFDGTFSDGLLVDGTVTSRSGVVLSGHFDKGAIMQGMFIVPNTGIFEGEFDHGKPLRGTLKRPDGSPIYAGEWSGWAANGNGTMFLPNGSVLQGEFRNGEPPAPRDDGANGARGNHEGPGPREPVQSGERGNPDNMHINGVDTGIKGLSL